MKPRDMWDREDLLDYLDGWHQESGLGSFNMRNGDRRVRFLDPTAQRPEFDDDAQSTDEHFKRQAAIKAWAEEHTMRHTASAFMANGRADRIAHREATGI